MDTISHKIRRAIETRILRDIIAALLEKGLLLSVSDGEEIVLNRSTDATDIFNHINNYDEATLIARRSDNVEAGEIDFQFSVFAHENWEDMVRDYSMCFEELIQSIMDPDRICAKIANAA